MEEKLGEREIQGAIMKEDSGQERGVGAVGKLIGGKIPPLSAVLKLVHRPEPEQSVCPNHHPPLPLSVTFSYSFPLFHFLLLL